MQCPEKAQSHLAHFFGDAFPPKSHLEGFFLFIYLFIFIFGCVGSSFLCQGFLHFAESRGHSSSRRAGLSPSQPLPLQSTGSRRAGPATVAHGPSRSAARGILPDQGPNPRPPHRQADSQPLRHQGSPTISLSIHLSTDIWVVSMSWLL